MATINTLTLTGRLARDPETQALQNGDALTRCALAFDYGYGERKTSNFIDVTLFGKTAEALYKYVGKGDWVAMSGQIKQETWEGKDGGKRSKIVFLVRDWHSPKQGNETPSSSQQSPSRAYSGGGDEINMPESDDDVPF